MQSLRTLARGRAGEQKRWELGSSGRGLRVAGWETQGLVGLLSGLELDFLCRIWTGEGFSSPGNG